MNPSNLTSIRQPHSRSRARRARRNHAAEPLPNQLLCRSVTHDGGPIISQTLERPQQTGILWEPGRLYPPRTRRVPGSENQQRRTQPQAQAQSLFTPTPNSSLSSEDGDAIADARKARVTEYISSWDQVWAAASTSPDDPTSMEDIPDISGMTISEPPTPIPGERTSSPNPTSPVEAAVPLHETPVGIDGESIFELSPSKSPEDSDGGVAIPQEAQTEARTHPTTAMQLAELRAKIPWLVEQRTIDGAGWRPLGEYYWVGAKKLGRERGP